MVNFQNILAFMVIISSIVLFLAITFLNRKGFFSIRELDAYKNLQKAIGLAIEQGKRLHISLGKANIYTFPSAASTFVGLSVTDSVSRQSSLSDKPPVITSGSGDTTILSQDVVRSSFRSMNAMERYSLDRVYLAGPTTFSYVAGTLPLILDEKSSTNVFSGSFGIEVALMTNAADRSNSFTIASSESLQGQATILACAKEALIGEDLFALPAHLSDKRAYKTSLHVQDILRWGTIFIIIIGSLLALVGIL